MSERGEAREPDRILHVRLLGEFEIGWRDGVRPAVESARAASLIAYLVLHRDTPQSRQRLAFPHGIPEGEQATAPLREVGTPIADVVRVVPYLAIQSMLDGGAPHGRHYYWRSHRLPTLSDSVIDVFMAQMASITTPFAQIGSYAVGGAVSRIPAEETAVGERAIGFDVNMVVGWPRTDPPRTRPPGEPPPHRPPRREDRSWRSSRRRQVPRCALLAGWFPPPQRDST